MAKTEEILKKEAKKILSLMSVDSKIEVVEDKKNEAFLVNISTPQPAILIGRHGETLDALQLVLSQILYKEKGQWSRVLVDTQDYRMKREAVLYDLAQEAAETVKQTGQPQTLFDLSPGDRRVIHLRLADDKDVTTESVGEGRERHLVVKTKE